MTFSKEQIEKASACKTVEELIALAKENGIELTADEAEKLFSELRNTEIDLDDVKNVAGGACTGNICGAAC